MKMYINCEVSDEVGAELLPKLIEAISVAQPDSWQLNVAAKRPDPSLQTLIANTEPVEDNG